MSLNHSNHVIGNQPSPQTKKKFAFCFRCKFILVSIRLTVTNTICSGLYAFDVESGAWSLLAADEATIAAPEIDLKSKPSWCSDGDPLPLLVEEKHVFSDVPLRARIGHSMTFFQTELHILAGQREHEYLADHVVYDVKEKRVVRLQRDSSQVSIFLVYLDG